MSTSRFTIMQQHKIHIYDDFIRSFFIVQKSREITDSSHSYLRYQGKTPIYLHSHCLRLNLAVDSLVKTLLVLLRPSV